MLSAGQRLKCPKFPRSEYKCYAAFARDENVLNTEVDPMCKEMASVPLYQVRVNISDLADDIKKQCIKQYGLLVLIWQWFEKVLTRTVHP